MKENTSFVSVLGLLLLSYLIPFSSYGGAPGKINFQGRVTNNTGAVLTGTYVMQFALYSALEGGSPVWSEEQSVLIMNGIYNVSLGNEGNLLTADFFSGGNAYLEVEICEVGGTPCETLSPRQQLTATAYAFQADNAATLGGLGSSDFALSSHEHSADEISGGKMVLSDSSTTAVISGTNTNSAGYGVYGLASSTDGSTAGVSGRSASTSGRGVYGYATAASGTTYGVRGDTVSPDGRGVYGLSGASSGEGYGVFGKSNSNSGYGVYGEASYYGVVGKASSASGTTRGVKGESLSSEGRAVEGYASTTSGTNFGVWGASNSPDGTAVSGTNLQTNTEGSLGGSNYGVRGLSVAGGVAVEGSAAGTTGRAASFSTDNATNSSQTVYVEQKGTGRAGHFRITNSANNTESVAASTTGAGAALSGYTVGAGPAVLAKTDGSGYALYADSTDDAAPTGGGVVLIGRESGNNIAIDGNEIMARNNGATSTLYLNNDGGDVVFGGAIDIGYEKQFVCRDDVESGHESLACSVGKKVISGGCTCISGDLEASFPNEIVSTGLAEWVCWCSGLSPSICLNVICANVK